jgi:hypothetical protein
MRKTRAVSFTYSLFNLTISVDLMPSNISAKLVKNWAGNTRLIGNLFFVSSGQDSVVQRKFIEKTKYQSE